MVKSFSEGKGSHSLTNRIATLFTPWIAQLGYQLLDVEYQVGSASTGGPILRVYIEHLNPEAGKAIGVEDCAKVDQALDPLLESDDFMQIMPQHFTLEVSSPGINRPLKRISDFEKFRGKRARIRTYSPVDKNSKQKNFVGTLLGIQGEAVLIEVDKQKIQIPLELVAKANLDLADEIFNELNSKKR